MTLGTSLPIRDRNLIELYANDAVDFGKTAKESNNYRPNSPEWRWYNWCHEGAYLLKEHQAKFGYCNLPNALLESNK